MKYRMKRVNTMSRFKRKNRVRILPLLLSLQLFIPNTLLADEGEGSGSYQHWKKTAQTLNIIQGMGQQMLQAHQQRIQQKQAQVTIMSMQRDLGIKQVDPAQVPPIISQNGCMVLEARTNKINSDLSCEGPYNEQLLQQGTYDALLMISEQNANTLANFLTPGHERFTTQGIGCYEKARLQLSQALEARVEMLNQMSESIKRRAEEFERLSRNDLMEIKKGDAILNGAASSKDESVKSAMKDYRFEDQFKDPACRSFFTDKQFQDMGKKGLRGIEQSLSEQTSAMKPKKFLAQSDNLEREIIEFGKHLQTKQENMDGLALTSNPFAGFNNRFLPRNAAAVKKAMDNSIDVVAEENKTLERKLKASIPTDDKLVSDMVTEISQGVKDGSVDIGFRLSEFERQTKNRCLNEYMRDNFGSLDNFVGRLQDPNISKKANKEADSSFKNYIVEILGDDRLTIEAKKKKIEQAQRNPANQRYGMVTGKSITVEGRNISASTRMPASSMVNMFVDNCVARFDSEPNSKGTTYRDIVNEMKSYNNKFSAMKSKIASRVASNVVNQLLRCPEDQSTGVDEQTCSADSMKSGNENFCLATAKKCAANINGCMEKAEKLVETARATQKKHVDTYKANMNAFKAGLRQEFEIIGQSFAQSARQLDGMFQMGTLYNVPVGLDLNLAEGSTPFLSDIDPALQLEDPAKYMEKAQQNIAKLKKTIEDQNAEVQQGFDDEVNKYLENYQKEQQAAEAMAQACKQQLDNYDQLMAQQEAEPQKAFAKQQEEIQNACKSFSDFRSNPCPQGGGSLGSLGEDMAAIAGSIGSSDQALIDATIQSCDNLQDDGNGIIRTPASARNSSKYDLTVEEFCDDAGAGAEYDECRLMMRYKDDYDAFINGNGQADNQCTTQRLRDYIANYEGVICRQGNNVTTQNAGSSCDMPLCTNSDLTSWAATDNSKCMNANGNGVTNCTDDLTDELDVNVPAVATYIKNVLDGNGTCAKSESTVKEEISSNDAILDDPENAITKRIQSLAGCETGDDSGNNSVVSQYRDAKEDAQAILNTYKRNALNDEVGQVASAACDGMGSGEVDLTGDPMQQLMRGIAGGVGGGAGFMQ